MHWFKGETEKEEPTSCQLRNKTRSGGLWKTVFSRIGTKVAALISPIIVGGQETVGEQVEERR